MVSASLKTKELSETMVEVKGRSPWADARARFARNRGAMVGLIVLSLICLFAAFGSHLTEFTYDYVDFGLMGEAAEKGAPSWARSKSRRRP